MQFHKCLPLEGLSSDMNILAQDTSEWIKNSSGYKDAQVEQQKKDYPDLELDPFRKLI